MSLVRVVTAVTSASMGAVVSVVVVVVEDELSLDEELSSFSAQDSIRPSVNAKKAAM